MSDPNTTSGGARRMSPLRAALFGGAVLPLLLTACAAVPGAQEVPPSQQATPTPVSSTDKDTQMSEPPANDETQAPPVGWAAGAATFTVGDRVFTVELTLCGMYGDGDDAEVVLAGPASENGGDATGFLEGDLLPAGSELNAEFRIDIGADGPRQSTDEFLALGLASGSPVTFSEEGGGYVVRSGAWNENGEDLGEGSLAFSCA